MDGAKPQPDQGVVDLVKRVQGGDTDAYTELFNSFHGPVLGYVYHMLQDRQAAEDVVQDAFIRAHQRIDQLGPPFDFKSWVFRIASNLAIDYTRGGKRFVDIEDQVMPYLDDPPSTRRPYEKRLQQDQQRAAVWRSLEHLPPHYRQALIMREFNELSYNEVAQALEVSYDNARQIVHRARTKFRDEHGLRLTVERGGQRCRELGDLLSAYRDDELDPLEAEEVRQHLQSCQDCQQEREEQEKVGALLAGLPPFIPRPAWQQMMVERIKELTPKGGGSEFEPQQPAGGEPTPGAAEAPLPAAPGGGGGAAAASSGGGPHFVSGIWPWLLGVPLALALLLGGGFVLAGGLGGLTPATQTPSASAAAPGEMGTAVAGVSSGLTASATQAATQTPSPSPSATIEPTLGPPIAIALQNSNCRAGPSDQFAVIGFLLEGQFAPIDGRSQADTYWWIERQDGSGHCYIWKELVETTGDIESVPFVDDPPTPTPVDETPPEVSVSHSPSGSGEPEAGDRITIQASASDNFGVAEIELWVNQPQDNVAQLLQTCSQQSTCSVQIGPYSGGTISYYAVARDQAGNEAQTNTESFNVQ